MAKVRLQIPDNASLNVAGHVYQAGDEFEAERDASVEQWLSAGAVTEVKTAGEKTRRKTFGSDRPGGGSRLPEEAPGG
jgi:hypothetical protein